MRVLTCSWHPADIGKAPSSLALNSGVCWHTSHPTVSLFPLYPCCRIHSYTVLQDSSQIHTLHTFWFLSTPLRISAEVVSATTAQPAKEFSLIQYVRNIMQLPQKTAKPVHTKNTSPLKQPDINLSSESFSKFTILVFQWFKIKSFS